MVVELNSIVMITVGTDIRLLIPDTKFLHFYYNMYTMRTQMTGSLTFTIYLIANLPSRLVVILKKIMYQYLTEVN